MPQALSLPPTALYGLPTTVLVSADGVVVAEVTGAVTEQRLLAMIHDHLDVTTG